MRQINSIWNRRDGGVYTAILLMGIGLSIPAAVKGQEDFRVFPYVQDPAPESMTVIWFSEDGSPGSCSYRKQGAAEGKVLYSEPLFAGLLTYSDWEDSSFFEGAAPLPPFRHRIRLVDLEPATGYEYTITQGSSQFSSGFRTAPGGDSSVRIILYADSETEPESTGKFTLWIDPVTGEQRPYLVDQTTGYRNNLEVICDREPDLIFVIGDLVETGGEQRDWDEFWHHNTGPDSGSGPGGRIPILAALGNHEYYNGPAGGGYNQPGSEHAVSRYLTYFEFPSNHAPDPAQEGRYYAIDYGPATFIVLDASNNSPESSEDDTNFLLLGESDPEGGSAPDFGPGSRQYAWMEEQLAESQEKALFTFVLLHPAPYSSGPHGLSPGQGIMHDNQSGHPVRVLTPLFMEYGVDAVFSGHDEMWERSELTGTETGPDGSLLPHTIHFYDVGTGGDGLREPVSGAENPYQVFLAYKDSPEVWEGDTLVSGGRHYGHLEMDLVQGEGNSWNAILNPVYVLPVKDTGDTIYSGFERHTYDDQVILTVAGDTAQVTSAGVGYPDQAPMERLSCRCSPNPFHERVRISYELPEAGTVSLAIFDMLGRNLYSVDQEKSQPGPHETIWDGRDKAGKPVPPGIYYLSVRTGSGREHVQRLIRQ